ncbi:AB hydrolase-1 domain-containing protein [Aphelenchoides besseyi]|nr:AB hydrolase-1 domain-containing protein [Aphelenchoides besseyi]KAI6207396.1 AB hydrolase-1 domain-containing protein [Aphelenchoides besseyi]
MLFVHGFPDAVAVDLHAYGDSMKLKGYKDYDLSQVAGNLIELIQRLDLYCKKILSKYCLRTLKVILCGHDWEGATSYRLAMIRPDLIEKMIVLNIYHPAVFAQLLKTPEQRKKSWYFFMFQIPFVPNLYLSAQDYAYLDRVYRSEEAGIRPIRQFRPSPLPKDPIQPKTLMIFGEEDAALSVSGARKSLEFCRDAELRTIPGASHWVQQDRPDLVNSYIEEFLST